MAILNDSERAHAQAFAKLAYCNPFLPERIQYEREVLADEFAASEPVWSVRPTLDGDRQNIRRLRDRGEQLAETMRGRILEGQNATKEELELYQDLVLYLVYQRLREKLHEVITGDHPKGGLRKIDFYRQFQEEYDHFVYHPDRKLEPRYTAAHVFAVCFQIRRAFHHIFRHIVGASLPAAKLRGAVWQSVFTADPRRYLRVLYDHMGDITTLIVGPSGTGKELVARAVALSRYIPFDPKSQTFVEDFRTTFHPLNLSALSPTLIESELFGHRRGAFTGALEDRAGWLEVCRPLGSVFLDEVGEIDAPIQVKLLRVLQTRQFQRLGDTQTKQFTGKIMAATNRDLAKEMHNGRIREDFYYRLCSDMIITPSLKDILLDAPHELHNMVLFIALHVTQPRENPASPTDLKAEVINEAEALTDQVERWIKKNLSDYAWPGNFRELEQCVRNILIRGEYWPAQIPPKGAREELARAVTAGTLTADELLQRYCTIVYAQCGSYEETARRLALDRRTVKAKIDAGMLRSLKPSSSARNGDAAGATGEPAEAAEG